MQNAVKAMNVRFHCFNNGVSSGNGSASSRQVSNIKQGKCSTKHSGEKGCTLSFLAHSSPEDFRARVTEFGLIWKGFFTVLRDNSSAFEVFEVVNVLYTFDLPFCSFENSKVSFIYSMKNYKCKCWDVSSTIRNYCFVQD